MEFAGRFRTVRRKDHAVSADVPRSSSPRGGLLDVRVWSRPGAGLPLLLVNAGKKSGWAVLRNRFRRRVRMAFLELLREMPADALTQGVVWVRPGKGVRLADTYSYADLKGQLKLALRRWNPS